MGTNGVLGGRRHRLAVVLGDQRLMELVRTRIDYTLAHASEDGYLGPKFFQDPNGDFIAGRTLCSFALCRPSPMPG